VAFQQTQHINKQVNYTNEQSKYLEWLSLPKKERQPKIKAGFANLIGVDRLTGLFK